MSKLHFILNCLLVGAGFAYPLEATAHIRLTEPIARYEISGIDTGIKGCPCGMATGGGNSNRTCDVEKDGSDSARDESRASTFPAGSTITLKFDEYIAHGGRYRVAFDPDGADFDDFNANVIHDETDPNGNEGNVADGSKWEIEVTLPNMECDNCTLQLLQVMAGGTENPVDASKLASLSTYYACIDLTLTAPEGNSTDEESSDTGSDAASSASESSDEVTSGSLSTTAQLSSGASPTSGESSSSEQQDSSSRDEASTSNTTIPSTGEVSTSPAGTASVATSSVTSSATTSAAVITSVGETTSGGVSEDGADVAHQGGCSLTSARNASTLFVAVVVSAAWGMLVRRRRR